MMQSWTSLGLKLIITGLLSVTLSVPAFAEEAGDPQSLVFVFQKQKDPVSLKEDAEKVAAYLTRELGMPVKTVVPTDYAASVQALVSKTADVAYVDSIPFVLARRDAGATLLLAEQRPDANGVLRTDYDSILVVRADSNLKSFEDVKSNPHSVRMAFTSTTSTSGYVMAYRRFVVEGVLKPKQDPREVFASVSFAGSYSLALQQVIEGRADLCAVSYYTMEGPKADVYLPKEQREKLRVLSRTPNVPTHVICARSGLSAGLRARIAAALLKLSSDEPELIQDVYGTKTFVEVDADRHVAATVEALEYLGVTADKFVQLPKK